MSKTCFIIGAGFSALANLPIQSNITKRMFARKSQQINGEIIKNIFKTDEPELMSQVPLEDIFTIFDKSILSDEAIANMSKTEMIDARQRFLKGITDEFKYPGSCFHPGARPLPT